MTLSTRLRDLRTGVDNRRTLRQAHRRLSDDLSAFRTPAERAELRDMLNRHSAPETAEIWAILNRQEVDRQRAAAILGGYRR